MSLSSLPFSTGFRSVSFSHRGEPLLPHNALSSLVILIRLQLSHHFKPQSKSAEAWQSNGLSRNCAFNVGIYGSDYLLRVSLRPSATIHVLDRHFVTFNIVHCCHRSSTISKSYVSSIQSGNVRGAWSFRFTVCSPRRPSIRLESPESPDESRLDVCDGNVQSDRGLYLCC